MSRTLLGLTRLLARLPEQRKILKVGGAGAGLVFGVMGGGFQGGVRQLQCHCEIVVGL